MSGAPPTEEPAPAVAAPEAFLPSDGMPMWYVCHTRPRCEKKFEEQARTEGWQHYLPLRTRVRRYGNRVPRTSKLPLFPGYVFVRIPWEHKMRAFAREHVARLIPVEQEPLFLTQLEQVRAIVLSGLDIQAEPKLTKGTKVRMRSGPLWGMYAVVEDPKRPNGVVVSMDVLSQGVRVFVPEHDIEVLE